MRHSILLGIILFFIPLTAHAKLDLKKCDAQLKKGEAFWTASSDSIEKANACKPEQKAEIVGFCEQAIEYCNSAISCFKDILKSFSGNDVKVGRIASLDRICRENIYHCESRILALTLSIKQLKFSIEADECIERISPQINLLAIRIQKLFDQINQNQESYTLEKLNETQEALKEIVETYNNQLAELARIGDTSFQASIYSLRRQIQSDANSYSDWIERIQRMIIEIQSQQLLNDNVSKLFSEASEMGVSAQALVQKYKFPIHLYEYESAMESLRLAAQKYTLAADACTEALNLLKSTYNKQDRQILKKYLNDYLLAAQTCLKDADDLLVRKSSLSSALREIVEQLNADLIAYNAQGMTAELISTEKKLLPLLQELIDYEGGDVEQLEALKSRVANYEVQAVELHLASIKEPLSFNAFLEQQKYRRDLFFQMQPLLAYDTTRGVNENENFNEMDFFSSDQFIPQVIPLDGTARFWSSHYTEQNYLYYILSNQLYSSLKIHIYKGNNEIAQQSIALPLYGTRAWSRYIDESVQVLTPDPSLQADYGLELRINMFPLDGGYYSILISSKGTNSDYRFAFNLNDESLFSFHLKEPLPWQLEALNKPNLPSTAMPMPSSDTIYAIEEPALVENVGVELAPHPLLDAIVDELNRDPIALAQYVQNEIDLVDPFLYQSEGIMRAPAIFRSAAGVFLDQAGSPWEQCALLIYLLRKAGYEANYIECDPYSMPRDYMERLLLKELPFGEEIFVDYPGVAFKQGEQWVTLFPWMKEAAVVQGHELYGLLTDEYASGDRWIQKYLMNDDKILKHIGSDGDDTAGVLFVRFLEEQLRDKCLSLDDVGLQRRLLKRQYATWDDFPRPQNFGQSRSFATLDNQTERYAWVDIQIRSKENRYKKIDLTQIRMPQLMSNPIDIKFTPIGQENHILEIGLTGVSDKFLQEFAPIDATIEAEVFICSCFSSDKNIKFQQKRTLVFAKGTRAVFCFQPGQTGQRATNYFRNQFAEATDPNERMHFLLSFIGYLYFEKCSKSERGLSRLHKASMSTFLNFGFVKFSPDLSKGPLKGEPDLKFPQVDMFSFSSSLSINNNPFSWKVYQSSANNQLRALLCVDKSSNEHQVLRDVFQDPYAISTVRLLQIAHQEHKKLGLPGLGFIQLNSQSYAEMANMPDLAKYTYCSRFPNFSLRKLIDHSSSIWKDTGEFFGATRVPVSTSHSAIAYGYITPGLVSSQNGNLLSQCSYTGVAALLLGPSSHFALITDNMLLMNGGFGSPLPSGLTTGNSLLDWELVPSSKSYTLKNTSIPYRNDYVIKENEIYPLYSKGDYSEDFLNSPRGKEYFNTISNDFDTFDFYCLDGVTDWRPEVRQEHKSKWDMVADPVDVIKGGFYIDEVDLVLPGPFSLKVRRNYSSLSPIPSSFGYGWKIGLNPSLKEEEDKLYAAEEDGTIIVYRYHQESDRWIVFPEDNPELSNDNIKGIGGAANPFNAYFEKSDGYILYGSDGSKRIYDGTLLRTWNDAAGNTLTFKYDKDELIRIESSRNTYIGFYYTPFGNIAEAYSSDGRRVKYSYNSRGDLTHVELPNGAEITYGYDRYHRIIKETKPHGNVIENVFDQDGRVFEQYSPVGPQQKMMLSATFTYEDGVTTVKDALEGVTTYKHFNGMIYKITDPCGNTILQSWFIDGTSWFDAEQERVVIEETKIGWQRSLKVTQDKRGLVTRYEYDDRGNVALMQILGADLTGDGLGVIEKRFKYNRNNMLEREECDERVSVTTYDEKYPLFPASIKTFIGDTLISYINYTYDSMGQIDSIDNSGSIVQWKYDPLGFPSKKTQFTGTEDPDVVTLYRYNKQGQCEESSTTDAHYKCRYDIMGNKIVSLVHDVGGELLSAEYIGYNLNDQPVWKRGADPMQLLSVDYTAAGKVKALRKELNYAKIEFDGNGIPEFKGVEQGGTAYTLFEYNAFGSLIQEVDALGECTYREYDPIARVSCETRGNEFKKYTYEPGGEINEVSYSNGAKVQRVFATNGLLLAEINPDGTQITRVYDLYGRVIRETSNGVTWETIYDDAARKIIRFHRESEVEEISEFDLRGNLIRRIDAEGYIWEKSYDCLNRLVREISPDGTTTLWKYEGNKVICSLPNDEKMVQFYAAGNIASNEIYDAAGELVLISKSKIDPIKNMREDKRGDAIITTWYNTQGFPVAVQEGTKLNIIHYDVLGQGVICIDGVGHITRTEYDLHGRMKEKVLDDDTRYIYIYDEGSNLIDLELPRDLHWKASYDLMGRKLTEELSSGGMTSIARKYTYRDGRLVEAVDPIGLTHQYQYDSLGRVFCENVGNDSRTLSFDKRGMLKRALEIGSHETCVERSYDRLGRIATETISLDHVVIQNTLQKWSPKGRSLEVNGHKREFEYGGDRLSKVVSGDFILSFGYDKGGLQIEKQSERHLVETGYNSFSCPQEVSIGLSESAYREIISWDTSGKLKDYTSDIPGRLRPNTYSYNRRGCLASVNDEKYGIDFGGIGSGLLTQNPDLSISPDGLDAFGKVLSEEWQKSMVNTAYDHDGSVRLKSWGDFNQEFKWDSWGRLIEIRSKEYVWSAIYDVLGRRVQTLYEPVEGEEIKQISYYDPESEFQEIGVQCGEKIFWKMYAHGLCEAVIDETGDSAELIYDTLGNLACIVTDQHVHWNDNSPSPYGWVEGESDANFETIVEFAQSLAWRSFRTDPTGYVWMGARYYNPKDGRFLSPDPVGYPNCSDLYSYANCDPINFHDPDGRFASEVYKLISNNFTKCDISPFLLLPISELGISGLLNAIPKSSFTTNIGHIKWSNVDILFTNGVNTTFNHALHIGEALSEYAHGHQIDLVYNPTGGLVRDTLRWFVSCKYEVNTVTVDELHRQWDKKFANNPDTIILQLCYSEGVTNVSNALKTYDPKLRNQIDVIAYCPSTYIYECYCRRVIHYCSRGDVVHNIVNQGIFAWKKNVVFLDPHPNSPFIDHDALSPTFEKVLKDEFKQYLKNDK